MSTELEEIWSRVQVELAAAVDEPTYRIWLEPLRARELAAGRLAIETSPQACGWVRERFGRLLGLCVERVLGSRVAVELHPALEGGGGSPLQHPEASDRGSGPRAHARGPREQDEAIAAPQHSPLGNPKLTFDQFVIGDCNRLAHAAALAVAEMPAATYNPLFICGPPGVGKTHLLSAIASLLTSHSPELNIRYTTGEAFTNDFLSSLAGQRTEGFKARFRHADVLLVDDVQFLERKARTEEEFFHTFNSLYDGGRQIVLTSDRPPRNLQALEDRLRERFECGLIADIRPPELSTRIAILRKRAHQDNIGALDQDTLELIAQRIPENVRSLEGALIRIVAYSSLTGRELGPDLARQVLDGLYARVGQPDASNATTSTQPSLPDVISATCEQFGVSSTELLSASRVARISWPRQVAMYLARELTGNSLPAIGREFGGRDHTTVMHACRRTASRVSGDPQCRQAVDDIRARLGAPAGAETPAPPRPLGLKHST